MSKKEKPKTRKLYTFLSDLVTIIMVPMIVIAVYTCALMFRAGSENTHISLFNYTPVRVLSGSMVKSGFNVGDVVLIHEVNTKSLKKGDIIAFYAYTTGIPSGTYPKNFDEYTEEEANSVSPRAKFSWNKFIGGKNELVLAAGKKKAMIYFHQIVDIRKDPEGNLWFQTKGTSNGNPDSFWTREALVVGKYQPTSMIFTKFIGFMGSNSGLILLVIAPLGILLVLLVIQFIDAWDRYSIESKIKRDKMRVTDQLSRDKAIGFDLSEETKLYVLLKQKDQLERQEAMTLMWHKGESPRSFVKYFKRKGWSEREEAKCQKKLSMIADKYQKTKDPKYIKLYQKEKEAFENRSFRKIVNKDGDVIPTMTKEEYYATLSPSKIRALKEKEKEQRHRDAIRRSKNIKKIKRLRAKIARQEERVRAAQEIRNMEDFRDMSTTTATNGSN